MSKAKGFVLVFLILGLAAGGYFLLRTRPGPPPAEDAMTGVVLFGYDPDGNPSWRVEAKEGKMERDKGELKDVTLTLYEAGDPRLTVSAPGLSFAGDRARFTGGVTVLLDGEDRLITDEIAWTRDTGALSGGKVEIVSSAGRIAAEGFSYDPKAGRLSLDGGVRAELSDPEKISAVGDVAEYDSGRMTISGDVQITTPGETYRCKAARYDSRTVLLSGGVEGKIENGALAADEVRVDDEGVTASGGVHLSLKLGFFGRIGNGA